MLQIFFNCSSTPSTGWPRSSSAPSSAAWWSWSASASTRGTPSSTNSRSFCADARLPGPETSRRSWLTSASPSSLRTSSSRPSHSNSTSSRLSRSSSGPGRTPNQPALRSGSRSGRMPEPSPGRPPGPRTGPK